MTRQVLYVAHALRPTNTEIEHTPWNPLVEMRAAVALRANLDRAMAWLSWLRRSFPETTFIAPWICIVLSGDDDSDPAVRERAMQDNFAVIERCDGIVLCGPRISEGMRREMEHGAASRADLYAEDFKVYDLTAIGRYPPTIWQHAARAVSRDEAPPVKAAAIHALAACPRDPGPSTARGDILDRHRRGPGWNPETPSPSKHPRKASRDATSQR